MPRWCPAQATVALLLFAFRVHSASAQSAASRCSPGVHDEGALWHGRISAGPDLLPAARRSQSGAFIRNAAATGVGPSANGPASKWCGADRAGIRAG